MTKAIGPGTIIAEAAQVAAALVVLAAVKSCKSCLLAMDPTEKAVAINVKLKNNDPMAEHFKKKSRKEVDC